MGTEGRQRGKGIDGKTHGRSVSLSNAYLSTDNSENLPLEKLLGNLPLSQRVYCLGYILGMSENECYNMISGFNDAAFAGVLSQQFTDAKAYVGCRKGIYYPGAKKMWVESVEILQEAYRIKVASLGIIEVGKKATKRDDFLIREATKMAVGKGAKPGKRGEKAEEEEDADDVILRRAENGQEADEED